MTLMVRTGGDLGERCLHVDRINAFAGAGIVGNDNRDRFIREAVGKRFQLFSGNRRNGKGNASRKKGKGSPLSG
jgi:hypothetical protein